jgi:hypothetical protein
MYYWKCWRDTRRGALTYLAVIAFFSILWLLPLSRRAGTATPGEDSQYILGWSFVCAWILALALGTLGPGADIGEGLGAFLLTRPRSRSYFAWTAWAAGLVEVVVLLGLTVGVMTVASVIRSGRLWYLTPWDLKTSRPTLFASIALIALVTYGITYLLTTIFKSGKRAIIGTIIITTAYVIAGMGLEDMAGITLPTVALNSPPGHPALLAIGWILVALACPLGAQLVLQRAEV